ncbi:hypothetical protein [Massilia horti]|uniref:Uncharacterized protein n=1 Tax=Massilia horti TaxID=2562153 RepID=A0A4Y9T0N7_9BURK|nr:hypothetical protein [Massilia horti]TFW32693.1 hypothetical protein E4O92_09085 [Massilia horti]
MHLIEMTARTHRVTLLALAAGVAIAACGGKSEKTDPTVPPGPSILGVAWLGFGGDAQHSAITQVATQPLARIRWKTAVDTAPQYNDHGYLFVHYGSPVITAANTVIVPVKRAAQELYRVEARSGTDGALLWSVDSDYAMPAHNWTPSYNVTLTTGNRLYMPGSGGKLFYRDNADLATSPTKSIVFYGDDAYNGNKAAFDASIYINTPITADSDGNIYFGFIAKPGNPAGLASGIARIGADGKASWAGATAMSADPVIDHVAMNSAPALSPDKKTLYIAVSDPTLEGYLLALDAATLAVKSRVLVIDPGTGKHAHISDDGTASPTVGPDGDVYFGVLESTYATHNARGWLLHFNADLSQTKLPGSFGWDDTPSIVPASMVPSYKGSSQYLLTIKYNNYARAGSGDSRNKVAVLDPNDAQADFITAGVQVMKEVMTVMGLTPDPRYPGGVLEWCINTAAVDPFTKSIMVNSEDGWLYRWDLTTNTLTDRVQLTSGLGESYTPTAVGPDGTVYAINNAVLFAVGK